MRLANRNLAVMLTVVMLITFLPASASSETKTTEVLAFVDPAFTIVIPASVNLGTLVKGQGIIKQDFDVEARDVVIEDGASIEVKVRSDLKMRAGDAELEYELYKDDEKIVDDGLFASFEEGRIQTGHIQVDTGHIIYAGDYSDAITFSIEYKID